MFIHVRQRFFPVVLKRAEDTTSSGLRVVTPDTDHGGAPARRHFFRSSSLLVVENFRPNFSAYSIIYKPVSPRQYSTPIWQIAIIFYVNVSNLADLCETRHAFIMVPYGICVSGSAYNIVPGDAVMQGTCRTFSRNLGARVADDSRVCSLHSDRVLFNENCIEIGAAVLA